MHASPNTPAAADPLPDCRPQKLPGCLVAGAGPVVVLLHASLGSKSQWLPLMERLAARYRVIALDLCGYGDNTALPDPGGSFTLDEEVTLVSRRLDSLVDPRTRMHVVGHSYGGLVALSLALARSDRVASLSLYEPVVFRMLDGDDESWADAERLAREVGALVAAGEHDEAARRFVDFWSGAGAHASLAPHVRAALAQRVAKVPHDFRAAACWPVEAEDVRALFAPTLLLIGSRSPAIVQRIHALLARALPNRRVGAFDCGHMGPVTHPHRVNPWIEAFVDLCAARDASRTPLRGRVPLVPGRVDEHALRAGAP